MHTNTANCSHVSQLQPAWHCFLCGQTGLREILIVASTPIILGKSFNIHLMCLQRARWRHLFINSIDGRWDGSYTLVSSQSQHCDPWVGSLIWAELWKPTALIDEKLLNSWEKYSDWQGLLNVNPWTSEQMAQRFWLHLQQPDDGFFSIYTMGGGMWNNMKIRRRWTGAYSIPPNLVGPDLIG